MAWSEGMMPMTTAVDRDTYEKIKAAAKEDGRSVSNWLAITARRAIRDAERCKDA
jgi:hypothetical protein